MSQIQEVELSIEQAEALVARGEKALKLADNADFKELVLEGYLRDEASRLARLSADFTLDPQVRSEVLLMVQAIGCFHSYMRNIIRMGDQARNDLVAHRETLAELHSEEE